MWLFIPAANGNITNNTFNDNTAGFNGGGAYVLLQNDASTTNIYNNIFWENTAGAGANDGDDLYVESDGDGNTTGSTVNLFNNILGLLANLISGQSEDLNVTDTDDYNQGGNIRQDPMLMDPAAGDFHLQAGSPCINAGDNTAPSLPASDFEGDARVINTTVDIGVVKPHQARLAAVAVAAAVAAVLSNPPNSGVDGGS